MTRDEIHEPRPLGGSEPAGHCFTDGKALRLAMLAGWIGIPTVIIWGFAALLPDPVQGGAASGFLRVLEALPTQWFFYAIVAALVSAWIFRHRQLHIDLRREFMDQSSARGAGLSKRDWWVAEGFRKRALDLRLRADLLLISVFALLFAGAYVVIFAAQIPLFAETTAREIEEQQFKVNFGEELDAMVAGHYWLKTNDADRAMKALETADETRTEWIDWGQEGVVFTTTDGGRTWRHRTLEFNPGEQVQWEFSANSDVGLVRGHEGSVFMTTDGGRTWNSAELKLKNDELVDEAALSADGRTGLVVGNKGTVFKTSDEGKAWNQVKSLLLADGDSIHGAAFSTNGQAGVVVSLRGRVFRFSAESSGTEWQELSKVTDGETFFVAFARFGADGRSGLVVSSFGQSLFITNDGGERWEPIEWNLSSRERVSEAAFSDDGKTVLVGSGNMDGSKKSSLFITRDGWNTWESDELNLENGESVEDVALSADGKTGLVVSSKGSVFITNDVGATWDRIGSLNLGDLEWFAEAAFSDDGQTVLVSGTKGSFFTTYDGGKTWGQNRLKLAVGDRVDLVKLDADGQTGLVAGTGSSIFLRIEPLAKPLS